MRRYLVGLVVVVLLVCAWMFRYERIAQSQDGSSVILWDRWLHRTCYTIPAVFYTSCNEEPWMVVHTEDQARQAYQAMMHRSSALSQVDPVSNYLHTYRDSLHAADQWEALVRSGMTPDQATHAIYDSLRADSVRRAH